MAHRQEAVPTLIGKHRVAPEAGRDEMFRRLWRASLQDLIEVEANQLLIACSYEHIPERTARRNGRRPQTVATPASEMDLAIPRQGLYRHCCPRGRVDKALYAVMCQG